MTRTKMNNKFKRENRLYTFILVYLFSLSK